MSAKNETIADIVAEMRGNEFDDPHLNADGIIGARRLAKGWADRIDAAWKREQNHAPKSPAPTTFGNAAALREVLVSISSIDTRSLNRLLYELVENDIPGGGLINKIIANVNKAKAALSGPPERIGNNAKMREALCDIVMLTMKVGYSINGDVACGIIASKAKHALSAPPRNCDVGTAEEQIKRWSNFVAHLNHLPEVPYVHSLSWAQMPYEAKPEFTKKDRIAQ